MTEWVWRATSPDRAATLAAYLETVERIMQSSPCHWRGEQLRFPSQLDPAERTLAYEEAFIQSWPAHMAATMLLVRRFERFRAGGE